MATATRTAVINDPVGIHARPASQFAKAAMASGCTVTLRKQPDAHKVNASSILSIMGLGITRGDTIEIEVEGYDAQAVADILVATITASE